MYVLALLLLCLPLFIFIGRVLFFKDWGQFGEALLQLLIPDGWSALQGEYHESQASRFDMLCFALACGLIAYSIHRIAGPTIARVLAAMGLL